MDTVGIMTFTLSGESFGVAAMSVREITKAVQVRPIEGSLPGFEGVIEHRGATIPVLDVRSRLGLGVRETAVPQGDLLVVECVSGLVAIDVDAVTCLMELPASFVDPDSDEVWRDRDKGILRTPDGLCVIEDLNTVLCDLATVDLEAAASSTA